METEFKEKYRILNRDAIKYIAVFTMLFNHISTIFMEPGHLISELFLDAGYFTAITMCYFLVEGFHYTHSKKKYAFRLAVFAILSEIPFCLAFSEDRIFEYQSMNMIFTLLICFLILVSVEKISNQFLKVIAVTGLVLLSLISDWALLAPVFTLLFIWARGSESKTRAAFVISMMLFGGLNFTKGIGNISTGTNILYVFGNMAGIAAAGIVILYLYNGKRMERGKSFSKWFFYGFYPAHLLILGFIRVLLLQQ